jgi:hypothetical protein
MTAETLLAPADSSVRTGWWNHPFQMFQTNLREIDATLDVETTLDAVEAQGANVWLLNTGGILSHYPSDLPFQTRNPLLVDRSSGDLIGDALTASHRRGVKLLARLDFSKIAPRIADEHPEWCFRSVTGEWQVYEGLVSVCPNGEYYQERTLDILDEILDRYAVDGFFFNWFGFNEVDYGGTVHGVCHCDNCARGFAALSGGAELPDNAESDNYLEWKRFASRTIDDLTAKIRGHIEARNPEAGLILGRSADILFHEANNALGRALWPHATSEAVSGLRVAQPHKAVLVNTVCFFDMPYRMASEQPQMLGQYLQQTLARGGNPSTYIMGVPGHIAYDCLATAAAVTGFHRDHADVYDGMVPAAVVGLVRPDPLAATPTRHAASVREFRGLFVGLIERHIPFDVVPAESLGRIPLDRFTLLIAPDLGALDSSQDAAITGYVEAGGHVLTTGATGIAVDGVCATWLPGKRQNDTESDANRLKSSYLQLAEAAEVEGSTVVPRYGTQSSIHWREGVDLRQRIVPAAPYGPPEKAYGHVASDTFACGIRQLGRGSVAQLGWLPGVAYNDLGLTVLRDAVVNLAIELADSIGPVEVDAAEQVEVILGRSDAGLIVHLLNHSGQRRNGFGPVVPVAETTLRVTGGAGLHPRVLNDDVELRTHTDGDDLVVVLGPLCEFAVIVFGGASHA